MKHAPSRATPGKFQVEVKAKGWFAAAEADEPAASTQLIVTLRGECFRPVATQKVD